MSDGTGQAMAEVVGHGIHVVDTGFLRPRFDAAYLLVERGRAAFIDTGTNHSVPRLLSALAAAGVAPDAVDFVILTHVHLDHAGGAGLLMQSLPRARLLAHPRGARHIVDPGRLVDGATAVYGAEEIERSYGTLVPVPEERVEATRDGQTIELASRPLQLIDTPGHALHHLSIWDAASRTCFTGDTFGLSYREFDTAAGAWTTPTSAPVQFQPEALRASVQRIAALQPACVGVTHYGLATDVPRLAALFLSQLDEMVALAEQVEPGPERQATLLAGLQAMVLRRLREHGATLPDERILDLLRFDLELNAQGLVLWRDRAVRQP